MASRTDLLARTLEDDIVRRGLRSGDRYLTAAEAAKMLDVSSMMANRAMQTLAERGVLVRHRSRGTFVGPKSTSSTAPQHPFEAVHLAISLDHHVASTSSLDNLIASLRRTINDVAVEIHFLPEFRATKAMQRLLERLDESDGLILVLSSRTIQSMVEESGIPSVVHGQTYPGIKLNCLQHDQAEIGRQIADYAISRGHARFALLTRGRWRRGDNLMHDAITSRLAEQEVKLNDLVLRSIAPDEDAIVETMHEIVHMPEAPSIVFCRNDFFADIALRAARESGVELPRNFEVISAGHQERGNIDRFARVVSAMSIDDQMDGLVELLLLARQGKQGKSVVAPVELVVPS